MSYEDNETPEADTMAPVSPAARAEARGSAQDAAPDEAPRRKPRLALMGEFSAGKSTLMNLMLGRTAVPTKVTATQLPPVWIAHGDAAPFREDLSGNRHPVDPEHLDQVPVADTAFIRLFIEAEVLEVCDLIDTPGISDPNMPPEVWQRAADEADGVIWLTHATQAWRQSEAAVWDEMPEELRARSLLLVTRFDKLLNDNDRARVLHRAARETQGLFRAVLPISLTQALAAGEDSGKWTASGGEAFSDALLELIGEVETRLRIDGARPRTRRGYPELLEAAGAGNPPDEAEVPVEALPDPAAEPARPKLRAVRPGDSAPLSPGEALRAALHGDPAPRPATGLRVVPPPGQSLASLVGAAAGIDSTGTEDAGTGHRQDGAAVHRTAAPQPDPAAFDPTAFGSTAAPPSSPGAASAPAASPAPALPRRVAPLGGAARPLRPRG